MTHPERRRRGSPLSHAPEAVKETRELNGLTKRELAQMAGISEQLMGAIESGKRNATPPVLKKLADALKCPIVMLKRDPDAPALAESAESTVGAA